MRLAAGHNKPPPPGGVVSVTRTQSEQSKLITGDGGTNPRTKNNAQIAVKHNNDLLFVITPFVGQQQHHQQQQDQQRREIMNWSQCDPQEIGKQLFVYNCLLGH